MKQTRRASPSPAVALAPPGQRVAVIGAGLAGLSAAWWLARRHRVVLFEREARPGFTAQSIAVPGSAGATDRTVEGATDRTVEGTTDRTVEGTADRTVEGAADRTVEGAADRAVEGAADRAVDGMTGGAVDGMDREPVSGERIDVPLRVFYPGYYPMLTRLYGELGVASQAVSYAAGFSDASGRVYFRYRNLRWGDRSYGAWAPRDALRGAMAWRIVAGLWRFWRAARHLDAEGRSVAEFVREAGLSRDVVEGFVLPSICTVCTCETAQARAMPAEVVTDYLLRGLTRQAVRRALHGADEVQRRLLAGVGELRCASPIAQLRHTAGGMRLRHGAAAGHAEEDFDHVVLATQANQALDLLGGAARSDEAAMLGSFRYVPVQVLTHRDAGLLPPRRRDWAPVNLRVDPALPAPESTIWINAVQPALRRAADLFQTVHPHREPRAELVLGRARFERPVVSDATATALLTLSRLHDEPDRRLWFCGSYAQPGIPLLESAVASAAAVAQRLGVET